MNENIRKLYQLNRQFLLDRIKTRTKRKEIRISPNKLPDYIRQNAPTVFVLSTGRTGTKLLTDLFSKVKGVKVYHNPSPVLLYTSKLCYESGLNNSEAF